jgi:hypothetical protein
MFYVGMFFTLSCAGIANFCAERTHFSREFAAHAHYKCRASANNRTFSVKIDTIDHHFIAAFFQIPGNAMFAGYNAGIAGVNTVLIFFVTHLIIFFKKFLFYTPQG